MHKTLKLLSFFLILASAGGIAAQAQVDTSGLREHVNRGNQLMAARQYQAAMSEYEAAKAIDPKNGVVKQNIAECHNNMGIALYRQKAYSDAIVQFQKCLEISPTHGKARFNMGLCREAMEREGIPDTPQEPEDKPDKKADKDADGKGKDKDKDKVDSTPKVVDGTSASQGGATSGVMPSNNTLYGSMGGPTYASGSAMFPVYSKQPSAINSSNKVKSVLPDYTPAATAAAAAGATANTAGAQASGTDPSIGAAASGSAANNEQGGSALSPNNSPTPAGPSDAFDTVKADSATGTSVSSGGSSGNSSPTKQEKSYEPAKSTGFSQASPIQTVSKASSTTSAGGNLTLEDQVAALELKVYGKKHSELPLLKRLAELETVYIGQVSESPMADRVEKLKKAIGQN